MDEVSTSELAIPDVVELRYPISATAFRVTFSLILAIGASLLSAAFLQVALAQAAARFGESALISAWVVLLAAFAGWVWWQSESFLLRADADGIRRIVGRQQTFVRWTDVATAEAIEPTNAAGRESTEGLYVVMRNAQGEKLISFGYDISRGLLPEQVSLFKKHVRAQLEARHITKEGPALAWINWG